MTSRLPPSLNTPPAATHPPGFQPPPSLPRHTFRPRTCIRSTMMSGGSFCTADRGVTSLRSTFNESFCCKAESFCWPMESLINPWSPAAAKAGAGAAGADDGGDGRWGPNRAVPRQASARSKATDPTCQALLSCPRESARSQAEARRGSSEGGGSEGRGNEEKEEVVFFDHDGCPASFGGMDSAAADQPMHEGARTNLVDFTKEGPFHIDIWSE